MVLREGGKGKREESEEIAGEREHRQTRPREAQKIPAIMLLSRPLLVPPSLPPSLLSSYLMMSMRSRRSTGTP